MEERLDVLDVKALRDPFGAGDVTGIATECHPPVDELVRRDTREGKNCVAFEVVAGLVARLPRMDARPLSGPLGRSVTYQSEGRRTTAATA